MEFQLSCFKSWNMILWTCCTQYASKFRKFSSGHRTGKVSFHSNQKERQCQRMFKVLNNWTQFSSVQFSSVQSLSRVQHFATPWTAARQASLSITNSRSSPKLMCIESVMPSSHLILGRPLLLLPSILPSIRVFSNESTLHMRWPKYMIPKLLWWYLSK